MLFLRHNFTHHNAREDDVAYGKVLLLELVENYLTSVEEFASFIDMKLGKLYSC